MGFKAWRNLGVLALAGASLVGCTSGTDQKNTKVVAPAPPNSTNNAWNTQPNQPPPDPRDPRVWNTQQQQPTTQFSTQGFNGQQQQGNGPAIPNAGTSQYNGQQPNTTNLTPGMQNQGNPYLTTPITPMPQPGQPPQQSFNGGLTPSGTSFGVGGVPSSTGFQGGASLAPMPNNLPPSTNGGFMPPAAPPNFPR